ncbi:MAG: hypothetical protein ACM3MK_05440 [Chitinophagales bacterium]
MTEINHEIKEALLKGGASLVGFADLSEIPEEERDSYHFGISIATALNPEIIKGIAEGPTQEYFDEYMRANHLLDSLDELAASILRSHGYEAVARVRASVHTDVETQTTRLPHKTVATRAGLGWIGKCALLITPQYGSAVRLSTVLTNAPLATDTPVNESRCADCMICCDVCPSQAPTGENWRVGMPRDCYYNYKACHHIAAERSRANNLPEDVCGLCILACPWTQKYLRAK